MERLMGYVFISYSSKDETVVNDLIRILRAHGFEVWNDREGIGGGEEWRKQIVQAIKGARVVLLVLTPHSVVSKNVRKELDLAEDWKKTLLPVELATVVVPDTMEYQLAGL